MTESSLNISFSVDALTASSIWLKLEQKMLEEHKVKSPSLAMVSQMVIRAMAGISASTVLYSDCPVEILDTTVRVSLPFYVWPSSMDLAYSLSSNIEGEISEGEIVEVERETDVIFTMSDSVDMGTLFNLLEFEWQTPCYNKQGIIVANKNVTSDGAFLLIDQPVFGVLRTRGKQQGILYTAHLDFEKSTEGADDLVQAVEDSNAPLNSITNVNSEITAAWSNGSEDKTTTLKLKIPKCALDILSRCSEEDGGGISWGGSVIEEEDEESVTTIWYSTCNGKILKKIHE